MSLPLRSIAALAFVVSIPILVAAQRAADRFDLVIANGRALDPETGLDATGMVVAPGFIDLHAHRQQMAAARMQAFDGVTTALELEAGMLPIEAAYAAVGREGRPINCGFAASWLYARVAVKEGIQPQAASATGSTRLPRQTKPTASWRWSSRGWPRVGSAVR